MKNLLLITVRRRLPMYKTFSIKQILITFTFFLVIILSVACSSDEPKDIISATPSPTPIVVSVQLTSEPYISPEPLIKDQWYLDRNVELESYVRQYGNYNTEDEIQQKVASMYIDPQKKKVAFTFDDGPRDELTDSVLDICEKYNVRVTFFIKGAYINGHEAQLKRMLSLGCEIGNHTWDHVDIEKLTADEIHYQIESVNNQIYSLLGYQMHSFRPPYISYGKKGSETRETLVSIMKQYNMAVINHTRSTHDTYDDYTEDMIYERCVESFDESGHGLHNSIILCHDKTWKTVHAFERAVTALLDQDYQLVTVYELLNCSPDGFHAGWIYSKAD